MPCDRKCYRLRWSHQIEQLSDRQLRKLLKNISTVSMERGKKLKEDDEIVGVKNTEDLVKKRTLRLLSQKTRCDLVVKACGEIADRDYKRMSKREKAERERFRRKRKPII